jgi:hypothetical protein
MTNVTKLYPCCAPVLFHHDCGWDAYRTSECTTINNKLVPAWFDNAIVEDAPTKEACIRELSELHVLGVCIAP